MGTDTSLTSAIRTTHDGLAERLDAARAMSRHPEDPRLDRVIIDDFLAATCKHLHAVDAVLLPAVRKRCADGRGLVRDQVRSTKELEIELAHAKAHEYGSTWETGTRWTQVWQAIADRLEEERRHEESLGTVLTDELDDDALHDLADRMADMEPRAPSRAHPYAPHSGWWGGAARRLLSRVDAFWDTAENRVVPGPPPRVHKRPGLLGQYLLADPRFDEQPVEKPVVRDED